MSQSSANRSTEPELGYSQLFAALIRQKFWFLGGVATALLGAFLFTLTQESIYESSMRLIIEPNYRQEYDPADEDPSARQQETDYATQLNLMRGEDLLQRAAERIEPVYPDLSAADISNGLQIQQVQENGVETRIINISYADTQPDRAQRALEALKLVYQNYALEQQEQRLSQGLEAINSQLEEAQDGLTKSQTDLRNFRQSQSTIDPQQQAKALADNLNQVTQQQYAQQEQLQAATARYETLRQQINLSPDEAFRAARLSQSPRFQSLLNALQATELELAERRTVYLESEPGVQILLEKRQNQARLLAEEAERVLGPGAAGFSGGNFQGFGQLSTLDLDLVGALADAQA
ncbi:MAG: capsular biosynthesis protein, partial [Phormidesmis sp.]